MDTVQGILTFMQRFTGSCLQSLRQRFVVWTKPDTTSLLLLTLTDLSRSKSELVAENVRLASTIDHPASTRETACLYQDGPHAPGASGQNGTHLEASTFHRPARDAAALASSGISAFLEVQISSGCVQTIDNR
jgi:hypothetical protein